MNYKIIDQKTYYSAGVFRLLEKELRILRKVE